MRVILLLNVGAIQESPDCFMWFWRALREAPLQIWYNFLVSSTAERTVVCQFCIFRRRDRLITAIANTRGDNNKNPPRDFSLGGRFLYKLRGFGGYGPSIGGTSKCCSVVARRIFERCNFTISYSIIKGFSVV